MKRDFLHEGQEKYPYCNFPPLHLRKKLAGSQGNLRKAGLQYSMSSCKPEATKRLLEMSSMYHINLAHGQYHMAE